MARLAFLGEKLQKFANLGVNIENAKIIKICTFWD